MKSETQTVPQSKQDSILNEMARVVQEGKHKKEARDLTIFLALLGTAIAGRVALQWVPSVEPIIPFAVLAGLLFGMKEGFMLGGSAYIISNFLVWGLQGPWTVFQAIGAAVPGAVAGVYGKVRQASVLELIGLSVLGTVFFEIMVNIGGALTIPGAFGVGIAVLPLYFLTSLPFSFIHTISNIGFAGMLHPLLKWRKGNEFQIVSARRSARGESRDVRVYRSKL
ncbi:MAG: hypothetical protein V1847_01105 [Candidatus Diapherotrites archaeon]